MNRREVILGVVMQSLADYNSNLSEADTKIDLSNGEDTRLFGGSGVLSSLNLVSIVVDIEDKIQSEFKRSIALASEKALSRRVSPYASIKTLVGFIEEELSEND